MEDNNNTASKLMNDDIKEILRDLEFASGIFDYTITPDRCTFLKDYITSLQQKLENKCWDEASIRADVLLEQQDYKSRCEKVDWWLREMLKQAKSDETKAIINGTLELLLGGRSDE